MVNPASTTASPRTCDVLVSAIEGEVKLDVAETSHRGHANDLAQRARDDGLDVVIAFGGDGTVNEVVNGLLGSEPRGHGRAGLTESAPPTLAVVPGGGTNVFARALGLPRDPVEATGVLLTALREGRRRSVGLGQVDDRWFTFNAGLGWDAQVVHAVDQRRAADPNHPTRAGHYVRAAVRTFLFDTDRRHPALTVTFQDGSPEPEPETGLHVVMVANTSPWTFLGDRPVGPFSEASFDTGLDVYALRTLRTLSTLRQARRMLVQPARPGGRAVLRRHDVGEVRVTADRPVALQVDGEPLSRRDTAAFRSIPDALSVVC